MSSDTPHWYVMDYLSRVRQYYGIRSAHVEGKKMKYVIFTYYTALWNMMVNHSIIYLIRPDIQPYCECDIYFIHEFNKQVFVVNIEVNNE